MTDLQIMKHAKEYIDKLAQGINPLTDIPVPENDVVKIDRISRCLTYVSSILEKDIQNASKPHISTEDKKDFYLSPEDITHYKGYDENLSISEITRRLNELANLEICKKLSYTSIAKWLISTDILEEFEVNGSKVKRPTANGIKLGVFTEQRQGQQGEYTIVLYGKNAQQYIVSNLDKIIQVATAQGTELKNHGSPWLPEHLAYLIEMYQQQVPIPRIATALQRKESAIESKLKQLGLVKFNESTNK